MTAFSLYCLRSSPVLFSSSLLLLTPLLSPQLFGWEFERKQSRIVVYLNKRRLTLQDEIASENLPASTKKEIEEGKKERELLLNRLISSETDFIHKLNDIIFVYKRRLTEGNIDKANKKTKHKPLKHIYIINIFANIDQILRLHSVILKEFIQLKKSKNSAFLGTLFWNMVTYLTEKYSNFFGPPLIKKKN